MRSEKSKIKHQEYMREWHRKKHQIDPNYHEKLNLSRREKYKNDSIYRKKERLRQREKYKNNSVLREKRRLRAKERYKSDSEFRKKIVESTKRYKELHPNYVKDKTKKYKQKYPEREKAKKLVRTAVLKGKLIKPDKCSKCGNKGKVEAHHENYSKPLEVVWLCKKCHSNIKTKKE